MGSNYQGDQPEKKESSQKTLYLAAHDLNNVMMTIAGSAELLLEATGENLPLRMVAERILRASKRGMALIENLKASGEALPAANASAGESQRQHLIKRIPM